MIDRKMSPWNSQTTHRTHTQTYWLSLSWRRKHISFWLSLFQIQLFLCCIELIRIVVHRVHFLLIFTIFVECGLQSIELLLSVPSDHEHTNNGHCRAHWQIVNVQTVTKQSEQWTSRHMDSHGDGTVRTNNDNETRCVATQWLRCISECTQSAPNEAVRQCSCGWKEVMEWRECIGDSLMPQKQTRNHADAGNGIVPQRDAGNAHKVIEDIEGNDGRQSQQQRHFEPVPLHQSEWQRARDRVSEKTKWNENSVKGNWSIMPNDGYFIERELIHEVTLVLSWAHYTQFVGRERERERERGKGTKYQIATEYKGSDGTDSGTDPNYQCGQEDASPLGAHRLTEYWIFVIFRHFQSAPFHRKAHWRKRFIFIPNPAPRVNIEPGMRNTVQNQ